MKKLQLKKLRRKSHNSEPQQRITNETVAEHREKVLAGGRRFKYPHQYVRHKLVINAVIITMATVIIVSIVGWWQLYLVQNTSEFAYRTTRVIPVPVASIDGASVRYSDYLMRYRSQELWLRNQGQLGIANQDDSRQLSFIKRAVMDGLLADIYAQKRADEFHVSASDKDVQKVVDNNRNTATGRITQSSYDASTLDTLGYAPDEYRHILEQSLLRQRVAYAMDVQAKEIKSQIDAIVTKQKKPVLQDIVVTYNKAHSNKVEFGASGLVPRNNQDGGLSQIALSLKNGEISGARESTTGDGYYFVQRLSADERQVSYQYIKVSLTVFNNSIAKLKNEHKIKEYISIPQSVEQKKQ